ncbi:MAG: hypothetical protein ACK5JO_17570, partial [Halodesulfovibrio sp.]
VGGPSCQVPIRFRVFPYHAGVREVILPAPFSVGVYILSGLFITLTDLFRRVAIYSGVLA